MRTLTSGASDQLANTTKFSEFVDADEPVLVYFWAAWCGPCKATRPILDKLSKELSGVSFGSLDVDDEPSLCEKYDIRSIPAFVLFSGKTSKRLFGFRTEVQLREWLGKV